MSTFKNIAAALIVGVVFGIGLVVSGMTQPQKVIGFLDVFGHWDLTLMFVMAGAIAVHALAYRLVRRRQSPLFDTRWHIPERSDITGSLVVGSVLFGLGWGLGGFCPGPAVTSLLSGRAEPVVFVIAMIAGMLLYRYTQKFIPLRK